MKTPQIPSQPVKPQVKKGSSSVYDTVNSKLNCSVYHVNKWIQNHNVRNATFHSLKFVSEKEEYNNAPYETELFRIIRVVESKLKANAYQNPIQNICVYMNLNMGRTLPDKENYCICKIQINGYKIVMSEIFLEEKYWVEQITCMIDGIQEVMNKYAAA